MKSKWKFILGGLLLIGIGFHTRVFAISANADIDNENSFSIMSYNVRLFGRYSSPKENAIENKNDIVKYVHDENPDIILFQEFYQQDAPTSFVTKDTLISLLNITDYHEKYTHKTAGRQNFGIMIMSKFPMIEKGYIAFENSTHNYCIYADIVHKTDTVRVYNVHLQSIQFKSQDYETIDEIRNYTSDNANGARRVLSKVLKAYPERAKQTEKVIEHIKSSPYPVIVAGDFNDTPMSYTYSSFNNILVDAYRTNSFGLGTTYAGNIPFTRIDYIFHSKRFNSGNFKIQKKHLSDHYAVSCRIQRN